jgi:LRP1 type putative zinc finger protein
VTILNSHADAPFRESLPRHVRGPAVFRCVQVTSVDDGRREVAYQAAVTINGHLFRGLLYDLGAEDGRAAAAAQLGSTSAAGPDPYGGGSAPLILGGLSYGNTP